MTNRIRIAAAAGILLSLTLVSAPAANAADDPYTRPCESVSDVNCTLTAIQVLRPGNGPLFLRSVNGGDFVPYTPEYALLGRIEQYRQAVTKLTDENREQFFEIQDLRPRALVAESKVKELQAKVARLRAKLRDK